jgi:putative hydrolase of the HAD superfamily
MLDAVVTSAEAGFRKPDPRIFEAALAAVQCRPERALFVGDSLDTDIAGGRAAGIRSVWLDRAAAPREPEDVERIFTLDNLQSLVAASPKV